MGKPPPLAVSFPTLVVDMALFVVDMAPVRGELGPRSW